VSASEEVVRARLAQRAADPAAISDAGALVHRELALEFEEPRELPPGRRIELRGDGTPEEAVGRVVDAMIAEVES
jgi:predicted kinase